MQRASKSVLAFAVTLCSHFVFAPLAIADVLPPDVKAKAKGEVVWYDGSGGATTRARDEAIFKGFSAETGVTLRTDFSPDLTKFFAAMDSGAPIPWSFVEFATKSDFVRAREAGYLEKLDPSIVKVSDLGNGAYDDYGVDVMRYGIVFTYNTEKFSGEGAPKTVRDLYDLKKFPGKRCLFKYPQYGGVLESALIADGADRNKLYPLDLDRAFKKLDSIKSDVIWWSNGDDAIRLISSGECSMGIAWSGRVYSAVKNDKAPLAINWKDSLYAQAVYAVPKGAPNAAAGQALIAYNIGDLEGQKKLVRAITYATDIKALKLSDYGEGLGPWIVAGDNAADAIQEDADYYTKHISDVIDRFNRWVALN
ncbi:extracellular solute-binding protein [Ancylobacter sp. 6x-1]|uniref:Extracellular solute-binding protein n=1 Tax=Ancylobacter crimeensis TaxID=2579147 RepID=A0ABT0DDT6_9HYPH|nr:extracellular solute-binding protein [Ancylobacter crimeensis]MCK0198131.1 extracellular solute-binding protein [Ancylobacter crimeensis]